MSPWLSKVENLGAPALGDEDVGGSDVSMHDALAVRSVNRVRDFDREGWELLQLHGTVADHVLEHHPVQKLHGDEGLTMLLADVIDSADVRAVEGGCSLGLALKTG
jgi:hypothetical protein